MIEKLYCNPGCVVGWVVLQKGKKKFVLQVGWVCIEEKEAEGLHCRTPRCIAIQGVQVG